MDSTVQAQDINVSLMISQELRNLRHPAAPAQPNMGAASPQQNAGSFCLRRDGARPMRFCGQLLFHTVGQWTKGHGTFDHELSVYLDDAQTVITALSLCPPPNAPLRPSFWAQVILDLNSFERLLGQWCRDVLTDIVPLDPPFANRGSWDALQSLTAHSLRVVQPHTERNEPCLL